MGKTIMHMATNARLISKVLTRYRSSFYALKELINNSIIAGAKRIEIDLIPSKGNETAIDYNPIDKIRIKDDGCGVPYCDFRKCIMEIATDKRADGCGVGRFGGLQIGRTMTIKTTAYDPQEKTFMETSVSFDASRLKESDLQEKDFVVEHELSDKRTSSYEVLIENLYQNDDKCQPKNKLGKEFQGQNLPNKLFEQYPIYIFEDTVKIVINGKELSRNDFTKEKPQISHHKYIDIRGTEHDVTFMYYSLIISDNRLRLFLQTDNNSVKTTSLELYYNSMWYSPIMGAQFVMIESDYITNELCDNFSLNDLGEKEWKSFGAFLKKNIDEHYKNKNAKYVDFVNKLEKDNAYPFSEEECAHNNISVGLFNQSAFIIEEDQKLMQKNVHTKKLVYKLLRKVIDDGNISFLVEHVLELNKESKEKLLDLLDVTNLEDVVNFSSNVASHISTVDCLQKITVSDVEHSIEPRSNIIQMLKKELWLFGEEYNQSLHYFNDHELEKSLNEIFKTYISIKPSKKDDNLLPCKKSIKEIEEQVLYHERRTGNNLKEILIILVQRPSAMFTDITWSKLNRYIQQVENGSNIPHTTTRYNVFYMATNINNDVRWQLERLTQNKALLPFYGIVKDNISFRIIEWNEFIQYHRQRLTYMSETLNVRERDAKTVFIEQYEELWEQKNKARLTRAR